MAILPSHWGNVIFWILWYLPKIVISPKYCPKKKNVTWDGTIPSFMEQFLHTWHNSRIYSTISAYMTQFSHTCYDWRMYDTIPPYMAHFPHTWHNSLIYGTFSAYIARFSHIWHDFFIYGTIPSFMAHFPHIWHNSLIYGKFSINVCIIGVNPRRPKSRNLLLLFIPYKNLWYWGI